jgi:hypothetical protein
MTGPKKGRLTNTQARLELMREAANDELFLEDLNSTMDDFRYADQLEHTLHECLTMR